MPGPNYPAAYPSGGDPGYRPSGGTALTAAGLAIPGGLFSLWIGILAISGVGQVSNGTGKAALVIAVVAGLLSGLALLLGAGLIMGGKPIGRWLVVLGCAVVIIALVVVASMLGSNLSAIASANGDTNITSGTATGTAIGVALFYSIPAIATLILAIVPLSGRYLAYRSSGGASQVISPGQQFGFQPPQQQGYPQQPEGYPQQPGYPQQQGFPPSTPGGFPQQGGATPPSAPGGFPQQPPGNPPQQW
jgi:hypothetical protein